MGLREQIKRLEQRAKQLSERELCPHKPPVIYWPDDTTENDEPHQCGRPRLIITIVYEDGSDRLTQNRAIVAFEHLRDTNRDIPPETIIEIIAERTPLLPETRRRLDEKAKASEAQ